MTSAPPQCTTTSHSSQFGTKRFKYCIDGITVIEPGKVKLNVSCDYKIVSGTFFGDYRQNTVVSVNGRAVTKVTTADCGFSPHFEGVIEDLIIPASRGDTIEISASTEAFGGFSWSVRAEVPSPPSLSLVSCDLIEPS